MVDLRLGDCLEVLPGLAAGSVDAVVTDPPYGISFRRGNAGNRGYGLPKHYNVGIYGDDKPFDPAPFLGFPVVVMFGANNFSQRLPEGGWTFWHKRPDMREADFSDGELIWANQNHPVRYIRHMWNGVLRDSEVGQESQHPTQKPVDVLQILLERYTKPGQTILDPFMGSGTTGVACMKLGRNFIGIERDESYFKIAQRRIAAAQAQLALPLFAAERRG
jgi:site-specific DNA-methyltransferase (adenine-specific)